MNEKELLKALGLLDDDDDNDTNDVKTQGKDQKEGTKDKNDQGKEQPQPEQNVVNQSEPAATQPEQSSLEQQKEPQRQDFSQMLIQTFEQMTGEKYDPTNPQHVVLINKLAQQLEAQQRVMEYLQTVVDKEFDEWLTEKMNKLPFAEVQTFQQAIQMGDLNYVKQFIDNMKKQFVMEKEGKDSPYKPPIQAEEKEFTDHGELDDIVEMILSDI